MTSRTSIRSVFLIFLAAFLAACSSNSAATDPGDRDPCASDNDCGLGALCIADRCEPGCRSERDCADIKPLCELDRGEHGTCVECLRDDDCERGDSCEAGRCVSSCASDDDCAGQHCDLDAMRCVECTVSSQCSLGNVCSPTHACEPGCFGDRDCAAAESCIDHQCVATCEDNADCAAPDVCDPNNHRCVECVTTSGCELGTVCVANSCVPGCDGDRDCPDSAPVCTPQTGTHGSCGGDGTSTPGNGQEGESCVVEACAGYLGCAIDQTCRYSCVPFFLPCERPTDTCVPDNGDSGIGSCYP